MSERVPLATIRKLCKEVYRLVSERGSAGEDWNRKEVHAEVMNKLRGKDIDAISDLVWMVLKDVDKEELNRGKHHDPHPLFPGWQLEGHIPTSENRRIAQAKAFLTQGQFARSKQHANADATMSA
jgi:hypothetical protein